MKITQPACRRAFALIGAAALLSGCEGLDYSASAEGTGVQIIGAIVVLAKYHASPQQKAAAQQAATRLVVSAAKPAYEKRRQNIEAEAQKKIATVERKHTKSAASRTEASSSASARAADIAQDATVENVKAEAAAELVAVDTAWRALGGTVTQPAPKIERSSAPLPAVPPASTRDREALIAAASAKLAPVIAIPVQNQGREVPKGAKTSVMLWDTRRQQFVSDDVLVLDRQPAPGKDVRVEGMTVRFAGN